MNDKFRHSDAHLAVAQFIETIKGIDHLRMVIECENYGGKKCLSGWHMCVSHKRTYEEKNAPPFCVSSIVFIAVA